MKCSDVAGAHCQLVETDGSGVHRSRAQPGAVAAARCERCSGLLYWTELREWDGSRGQDSRGALQCILCGNIIDPVIVKNRQRAMASLRGPGRRWRRIISESLAHGIERERD